MKLKKQIRNTFDLLGAVAKTPEIVGQLANKLHFRSEADVFARQYTDHFLNGEASSQVPENPLWEYFNNHSEGHGITKWEHYFDIYDRHFAKFIGQKVDLLEIGIYSGGSLDMWKSYFGAGCHIYGIDIAEVCKSYEDERTSVFIGDQEDRTFWKQFRDSVPGVDILIDDGGHTWEQQKVTLEEMLPNIRPGGVYLCEDIHAKYNGFAAYASSLVDELNARPTSLSQFQRAVHSIHFYPYVVVIEKHIYQPSRLASLRHGTKWQPFRL